MTGSCRERSGAMRLGFLRLPQLPRRPPHAASSPLLQRLRTGPPTAFALPDPPPAQRTSVSAAFTC